MPRYSEYDELTPQSGRSAQPVDDPWSSIPDSGQKDDPWSGIPDEKGTPIADSLYPETKFNVPSDTMGEPKLNMPKWSFAPGEEVKPADEGFSLNMLKDQLTWPNAFRMGVSTAGDIVGGLVAPVTFGAAYPALSALGGGIGEAGGQLMEGKSPFDLDWKTIGTEAALNPLIPGPNMPGEKAGLKAFVKYVGKQAEAGALQAGIGVNPRKWAKEGFFDKEGKFNYAGLDETAGQVGAGFVTGGVVGAAAHAGITGYRKYKASPMANGGLYTGEVPSNARQAGNTSTVWDDIDFTQPVNEQKLLGAAPPVDPVVTLKTPDIATIQHWRDQGYVMVDRSPEGYFRMAPANVADQYITPTPEGQDINLQYQAPDNVVPFPQKPTSEIDLDAELIKMGAGNRQPVHNQEDAAWEETPDDAIRNGPVGIVQNQGPFSDSQARTIVDRAFPPPTPEAQPATEYGQSAIDQEALQWMRGQDEIIRQNQEQNGPIMGPVNPDFQPEIPFNQRTVGRARRALRDTVPTDTTPAIEPNPRYPERPFEVQDYQQFLPELYSVRTDEGGTGSSDTNRALIRLREELGREPTPEELENAVYPEDNPTNSARSNRPSGQLPQYETITEIMAAYNRGELSDQEYLIAVQEQQNRLWDAPQRENPNPTPQIPWYRSMAEIMTEYGNGGMTRQEYEAAVNDYQEREWNRGARDRTRLQGRAAPPDPDGILTTAISEIDASNDAIDVESMSRMYDDDIPAFRHDGDHARANLLQYLSDYAFDRGSRLRDEEYRNSPPPAVDSLTDFWDEIPNQSDDIDNARMANHARDDIDASTTTAEAIEQERYWEGRAREVQDSNPVQYRIYRDLAIYASDREAYIRTNGRMEEAYNDSYDEYNPESMSRMRHRANVARARRDREFEESQFTTSPLPVYATSGRQQTLPGMESQPPRVIKEGYAPPDAETTAIIKELEKAQPKIPNLKKQRWWDQKIAVSQATLDAFDKAIATVSAHDLSKSISHSYARSVLMGIRDGEPGITLESYGNVNFTNRNVDIIYRGPNGKGVAKATVEISPNGDIGIPSLASDKESGLYGRAVVAIARELVKLNAFKPNGSYSLHTKNFMKSIRDFVVVDESISDNTPESKALGETIKNITKEAPEAIGEELDAITEAVQEAQHAAQVLESPVTVREVTDRIIERQAENRRLRIEKGEILGGSPDDNGPGTTVGSIFGGLGAAAKNFSKNAGWGQGGQTGRPNVGTPPNTPPPTPANDYSFIQELMQLPKNAVTTLDVSFAGRQALGAVTRLEFWKAFAAQFKGATQRGFDAMDAVNRSSPIWQQPLGAITRAHPNGKPLPSIGERMGLTLYQQASNPNVGPRQEQVASKWLETGGSLPYFSKLYSKTYGKAVRTSNRMYLTMANTLTTKLAESLVASAEDMSMSAINRIRTQGGGTTTVRPGIMSRTVTAAEAAQYNPYINDEFAKELGDFVRTATGHAPLKAHIVPHQNWETDATSMAGFLNKTMFGSGLFASRLRLTIPGTYMMASPMVRKEYMRAALGVAAFWWGSAYAMKMALQAITGIDAYISLDWTSSDFGKLRVKNTRLDLAGGHQQFLVNYGRIYAGGKASPSDYAANMGTWRKFGEGYRSETQGDNLQRFASNKLEPVSKFVYDLAYADKKNPFHVGDRLAQLAIPLYMQDLYEIYKEDPRLLPLGIPAAFGAGTQIYDRNESVAKIIPAENDWLVEGGGGLRALMPWNWGEPKGEYQGPGR